MAVYHEIMRISTLDLPELVGLIASFHNVGDEGVDDGRYSPAQIQAMRAAEKFSPKKHLGVTFHRHYRNFPCENYDFYSSLYTPFEKHGVLPFEGCLADQPAQIMEVFNILSALFSEQQIEKSKKGSQKNGR